MRADLVSTMAEAAIGMCELLIGTRPGLGALEAKPFLVTDQQINAVCIVTGALEGVLVYSMSVSTADRLASHLTGVQVVTFDQIAADAIAHLSSRLSGAIAGSLLLQGLPVSVQAASIIRGVNVPIAAVAPALVVPLQMEELGSVSIAMALRDSPASLAA